MWTETASDMASSIPPDALAIDIAYRSLATALTLKQVIDDPALRRLLFIRARRHMQRRARFDPKRLQANDNDD